MRKILKALLWVVLVFFVIRIFIFQTYKTDSFNMSSTLLPGDRILINKIYNGARFPNSILGLPGANKPYLDIFRIPYFRLPGFKTHQRNEITIYNDPRVVDKPLDRSPLKISRIVALPGDTVNILDKELFVNRNQIANSSSFRRLYRVVTDGEPISSDFLSKYSLEEPVQIAELGMYDYVLDSLAYNALLEFPTIKTTRLRKQYLGDSSSGYFPFSSFFFWNRDQFGPVVIPKKGVKVDINLKNIDLYRMIIDLYEGNDLIVDYSGVRINGVHSKSYTFKNDYYFLMDDNRDNPEDSRIVGFIPEKNLIGTSKWILTSGKSQFEYLGGAKLKRFFKKIE